MNGSSGVHRREAAVGSNINQESPRRHPYREIRIYICRPDEKKTQIKNLSPPNVRVGRRLIYIYTHRGGEGGRGT